MATLSGHTDGVFALAALDGNRVASGGQDDTIKVWDVSARGHFNCVATLQSENKLVRALASLQGSRCVPGSKGCVSAPTSVRSTVPVELV